MDNTYVSLKAPFIHSRDNVRIVMTDVLIALLPLIVFAYIAHGLWSILCIGSALVGATLTELIFSWIYFKRFTLQDLSFIVTAILMSATLSPFTPWYVVLLGGACAVLFGKLLWGGIGRNPFNPALVGREFITAFFPLIMASRDLWSSGNYTYIKEFRLTGNVFWDKLIFQPYGAIGEYSALLLVLGGIFLLLRKRISYHIPLAIMIPFFIWSLLSSPGNFSYSFSGVLLGAIYMATDMPSSPLSSKGKFYYGLMIGIVAVLCIYLGLVHEYMSYSILILNGFSKQISELFRPEPWGHPRQWKKDLQPLFFLTVKILAVTFAVESLSRLGLTAYAVFLYMIYLLFHFNEHIYNHLNDPL